MSSSSHSLPQSRQMGMSSMGGDDNSDDSDLDLLAIHDVADISSSSLEQLSSRPGHISQPSMHRSSPASSSRTGSPSLRTPQSGHFRNPSLRSQAFRNASSARDLTSENELSSTQKENADYYVEGPGRRVGYDDLTAIDWIFEYTKERQRLRKLLAGSHGMIGNLRQLIDASQVWVVLVLTGVFVGFVAGAINIASDWLGDIKTGFCKSGQGGGQFYLNRQFCCWGHDELAQCQDWTPWRTALGISNLGGAYIVEYIFYVLYAICFATAAATLVKFYSSYASHSGIPEIKTVLGGFVMRRFLGGWTLITKSIGLILAVSSGLWLGKEGPFVHVACCCANVVMKAFDTLNQNEARKREIFSAAAAAGISVAFGSPIGGVLFSLEQLSYYFPDKTMWQSFVCAMVAAVTLQAIDPFHTGKIVLYQVTYSTGWYSFEIIPFAILGIIGGLYGGLFIKLNMLVTRLRRSQHYPLRGKPRTEVLCIALLTALVNFPNLFMRAQLSELVYYLFAECATIGNKDIFGLCKITTAGALSMSTLLITAAGLGFLLASITFGLQIPAGIILPSLAIGALYGRALGVVVELLHKHFSNSFIFSACLPDVPCITPGTYAIVGAASALAGVTRMTVSIVVIMFELTGALTYVLPIMIAVMLAKWVGDVFSLRGIYESWIQVNEYPYLDNKDDAQIPHIPVSNIMTRIEDMTFFNANQEYSVASLRKILRSTTFRGFPVVALKSEPFSEPSAITAVPQSNTLVGYISRVELSFALDHATVLGSHPTRSSEPLSAETLCYFAYHSDSSHDQSLDLRPWMDQTPITLNSNSSLQLAVSMFQKLGLRYLLFVNRGAFQGILTKKDVWWLLNASEHEKQDQGFVAGTGVLREDDGDQYATDEGDNEGQGLLRDNAHETSSMRPPT